MNDGRKHISISRGTRKATAEDVGHGADLHIYMDARARATYDEIPIVKN